MDTLRDDPSFPAARHGAAAEAETADPCGLERLPPNRPSSSRWWLWPHLGSLDAPLVAVVWQEWWTRGAGGVSSWQRDAVLALAVWLIYLSDRLADVSQAAEGEHRTSRHLFYRRRRVGALTLAAMLAMSLALTVVTPCWLTRQEFGAGLVLLGMAAAYFWTTHRRGGAVWTTLLPKEGAVGLLFALGSALFAWCRVPTIPAAWGAAVTGFAGLCFLNCALITRWEISPRDLRDPASLLNAFPGVVRRLPEACAALALAAGLLAKWSSLFLPVAIGAGLLWSLDFFRFRLSADALRVLADAALLVPLIPLVFS